MPLQFLIEPVEKWAADAKGLIVDHWRELGLDQDLEIAPDIGKMQAMESQGHFFVITARQDGELVGYLLAVVHTHLHYSTSKPMLIVDAYYIKPENRTGTGVRLLRFMEDFAKKIGCIKIYLSCKVHKDHSKLFTTMGYALSDYAFIKRV